MATAMAIGYYGKVEGDGDRDRDSNRNGDGHGNGNNDKGRVASSMPAMCSTVAGATPCLHPHGHKGKCIHQHCVMTVTLLRVFAPF